MPIDTSYGRIPVEFPEKPYPTHGHFAAYITSFLPNDPDARPRRLTNLNLQLRWWRLMTDMPVHVVASNWTQQELANNAEILVLAQRGGSVTVMPSQILIHNRIACLEALYKSQHSWGVIMDDDAVLYHSPKHNSGGRFFAEMAGQPSAYTGIDVFFPINPAKVPGQNQIWAKAPQLYADQHVFEANYDLKGSMFVVRNFPRENRSPVLPPSAFREHGEDTLFAIEAINQGCTVYRCANIVLKEFSGPSHFSHERAAMKAGNEVIAALYADRGLRMNQRPKSEHLLDRTAFLARKLPNSLKQITVPKPKS